MKKKTKRTGHFNRALALLFTALLVLQAGQQMLLRRQTFQ